MKVEWKWFDLWIGIFIDTNKKKIYICPFPTLVFIFDYGLKK